MAEYRTTCASCGKVFYRDNRCRLEQRLKSKRRKSDREFCCHRCFSDHKTATSTVEMNCGWCNSVIVRKSCELKKSKSGFIFCNKSCSTSFHNTKKRRSNRSKCEEKLFNLLKEHYPEIDLIPNDKILLEGMEADIAIPSLNLVIEWNGIVHYKPIYGDLMLNKIQQTDAKKQEVAQRKKLNFIVVPDLVSTDKYVREAFHSISKIIDELNV